MKIQLLVLSLLLPWIGLTETLANSNSQDLVKIFIRGYEGCTVEITEFTPQISLTTNATDCKEAGPKTFLFDAATQSYNYRSPQFKPAQISIWYQPGSEKIRVLRHSPSFNEDKSYYLSYVPQPHSVETLQCLGEKLCVHAIGFFHKTGSTYVDLIEVESIKKFTYRSNDRSWSEVKIVHGTYRCDSTHGCEPYGPRQGPYYNIPITIFENQTFTFDLLTLESKAYPFKSCHEVKKLCLDDRLLVNNGRSYKGWLRLSHVFESGRIIGVDQEGKYHLAQPREFLTQSLAVTSKKLQETKTCESIEKSWESFVKKSREKYSADLFKACFDSLSSTPGWTCANEVKVRKEIMTEAFCQISIDLEKQKQ